MKSVLVSLSIALLAVGCASTGPAGMKPQQFVSFQCATGKSFQARFNPEANTVRVRALHGSVELVSMGQGKFGADDYVLETEGANAVSLLHKGKPEAAQCKVG
jgi:hypothetical protein